jgi:hypothetical protein
LVTDVDVVDVVVVGEFDMGGPDSLGVGAAFASTATPVTTAPTRQVAAKSLSIMSTLRFRYALLADLYLARVTSDIGFNGVRAKGRRGEPSAGTRS